MIKKVIIVLLIGIMLPLHAQDKKDKVLLTIDNEPVYVSEFLKVYNKNNDVVGEENKKNINEYMELFINYKLKLKEAYDIKLDTVKAYVTEYTKYKEQLTEPFLKDRNVSESLVKEAYDRMNHEVNASHILVRVEPHALPKDTLAAYNRLLEARDKILGGQEFSVVAKQYSKDPSVDKNGGNLGYFTAFSMVYPFESAAFNTTVGEVSLPFKTNYGYHIVQVHDKRVSKGEVKAAHIMIKHKKEDTHYAKKQMDDIYSRFKEGEEFEFLARKYSEDKTSAAKGGALAKFTQARMIQPFGDIAFSLENINDVSEPFETKFGWHIVKLLKKIPLKSYEELKDNLTKQIEKGDRSVVVGKSVASKLRNKYKVEINDAVLHEALNTAKDQQVVSKTFLTVEGKDYTTTELKNYFRANLRKDHNDFIDEKVLDHYKKNLESENEEFAATLKEYREGLLLFELLQQRIWTKAEKDTIGLQDYFEKNKEKYVWNERVDVAIASCTREEKALLVQKYLKEGKTTDEVKELVNEGATVHVLFNTGVYELDSKKLPKGFVSKKGVSEVIKEGEKRFFVVDVKEQLPKSQKELKDTRGKVISDYQDHLEKEWIKELRSNYNVEVNKKTLKKLNKKYK